MKTLAGLSLALVTGCTMVPVQRDSERPTSSVPLPSSGATMVRVGVEYLPPDSELAETADYHATGSDEDRTPAESQSAMVVSPLAEAEPPPENPRFDELQVRWELARDEIRRKRNSVERVTLRFLSELMGDDRKRVQRALGTPLLGSQLRLASDPLSNFLDERDREDHQRLLTKNGTRMIRRPIRNALKELPILNDVELAIHQFKTENPYVPKRSSRRFGRVSVRIRVSHFEDPIEIYFVHSGVRVGSSLDYFKASYTAHLTQGLSLRLRSRYDYDDSGLRLFGNLEYKLNEYTTIHALAGNRINTLSGPATYPGGPQSDEKTKGVLIYVEHLF